MAGYKCLILEKFISHEIPIDTTVLDTYPFQEGQLVYLDGGTRKWTWYYDNSAGSDVVYLGTGELSGVRQVAIIPPGVRSDLRSVRNLGKAPAVIGFGLIGLDASLFGENSQLEVGNLVYAGVPAETNGRLIYYAQRDPIENALVVGTILEVRGPEIITLFGITR